MFKHISLIIGFLLIIISTLTHAETIHCPSVQEIKEKEWIEWLPLYIDREELASYQDVEQFKKHVTQFVAAKWSTEYLENGHCFYQGTDPILDRIVYAHDAWRPEENFLWQWLMPNKVAECRTNQVEDCPFIL